MWFLTTGPVVNIPMILAELPDRKNCGSFFKKHNGHEKVQFFDVDRCVFSCLHLAVGRHHVIGLLNVLMVSNSAELRSFLLTICILAPESTTNSLPSGSLVEALGRTFFRGRVEFSFVFFFELVYVLARFHALLRAHRCCLSVSSWDGTSLMKIFDLYLSK